jgi:hypothetical protein
VDAFESTLSKELFLVHLASIILSGAVQLDNKVQRDEVLKYVDGLRVTPEAKGQFSDYSGYSLASFARSGDEKHAKPIKYAQDFDEGFLFVRLGLVGVSSVLTSDVVIKSDHWDKWSRGLTRELAIATQATGSAGSHAVHGTVEAFVRFGPSFFESSYQPVTSYDDLRVAASTGLRIIDD